MKMDSIIIKMNALDMIYERIISNLNLVNNKGLLDGKMGVILFLYKYSRIRECAKAKEEADIIVDELWTSLNLYEAPFSFFAGHPGIAWGLFDLVQKGFLEIDNELNSYLESVDFSQVKEQKAKSAVIIDIESGLFTTGVYYLSRNLNVAENYYWRENAIYLIEDCERILLKKTSYNNIFLPNLSLGLLNSILYFLIETYKQKIYPLKNQYLIKNICCQIVEIIESANIQDIIVSRCLLLNIIANTEFCNIIDVEFIEDCIRLIPIRSEDFLDILSELGLYALLYDNKSIFEAGCYFFQYNQKDFNILIIDHLNQKDLSIKVLLGMGFGLLAKFEEYGKDR